MKSQLSLDINELRELLTNVFKQKNRTVKDIFITDDSGEDVPNVLLEIEFDEPDILKVSGISATRSTSDTPGTSIDVPNPFPKNPYIYEHPFVRYPSDATRTNGVERIPIVTCDDFLNMKSNINSIENIEPKR